MNWEAARAIGEAIMLVFLFARTFYGARKSQQDVLHRKQEEILTIVREVNLDLVRQNGRIGKVEYRLDKVETTILAAARATLSAARATAAATRVRKAKRA